MRVAIDVLSQSPGASTGALSLYLQLARFLPERDPGTEYLFFAGSDDAEYYQSKSSGMRVVPVGWGNRQRLKRVLSEHILLGPALKREKVDVVFHSGSGVAPFYLPGKGKLIQAVWGMQHVAQAEITRAQRLYRRSLFARGLRRADVVLVNSAYTRDLLMAHYRDFSAPVDVIHHGVDLALFNPRALSETESAALADKGVSGPFVLFVGQIYPYKLLHVLAEAFCLAMSGAKLSHKLVVVGSFAKAHGMGEAYRDRIAALLQRFGLEDRLVLCEDINVREMRALYAAAAVYVQPSAAETFGRTVTEAMACGCPVVAAEAAATPEILGDAGLYYRPDDVEACSRQILRVLQDDALRVGLSAKGLARVTQFSFDNEVSQMIALFHRCCDGG